MNKDLRNTLVWMIFATCVVGLAFWQAQVTVAQEMAARHKVLPQPAKTRHAIRSAPAIFTDDPVFDYIARWEKGITDREIGWIIEDFQMAGLDFDWQNPRTTVADLVTLRTSQHRWYREALVDALRLSPEQSAQVAAKLDELLDKAKADFMRARETLYIEDETDGTASPFVNPDEWLRNDDPFNGSISLSFQPWNLCQLMPEQQDILSNTEQSESSTSGFLGWNTSPLPKVESHPLKDPISAPGVKEQIAHIRALHPAQLKMILLHKPALASQFQSLFANQSH